MRCRLPLLPYCMMSALLVSGWAAPALALEGGIRLNQTRVIITEKDKNAAVTMTNGGAIPYLVKATVAQTPDNQGESIATVPFVMTPPLFRLEADNRHTLLVVKQGQAGLPADRESVFYLGFLAIPATTPLGEDDNQQVAAKISVGIKSTIKLFYRPAGLPINAPDAAQKLTVRQTSNGIELNNPTPYYVTLSQLTVNGHAVTLQYEDAMLSPYGKQHYTASASQLNSVKWKAINDYGGETEWYTVSAQGGKP